MVFALISVGGVRRVKDTSLNNLFHRRLPVALLAAVPYGKTQTREHAHTKHTAMRGLTGGSRPPIIDSY